MKKLLGNWRNTAEPSRFYRELVQAAFRPLIPSGPRVLECGTRSGALLASVEPAFGAGICNDPKTLKQARKSHPEFEFYLTEEEINKTTFDYIVANDLVNHLPDVQLFLSQLHRFSHARTRIIFNLFNNAWRPFLWMATKIGIRNRSRIQNWISPEDMRNLLYLAGWELINHENRILWFLPTPSIRGFLNRWFAPVLGPLCLTGIWVARPLPLFSERHYCCSVVVPARNEKGNIEEAEHMDRPIFVDGNTDLC
jgi:hypothetical protein